MRQIGSGSEDEWNGRIIEQLSFIKKHLRYPVSRRTMAPAVLAGIPGLIFLLYFSLISKPNSHYTAKAWLVPVLVSAMMIPTLVTLGRYLQTLRFIAVPARRSTGENMLALQQFLQGNHLAFARHPEAPEVFQIISKNISALRDEREVVVFIADNGRILVNAHFTQNRFRSAIGVPHHREMAKKLAACCPTAPPKRDLEYFRQLCRYAD